jgi:hypothetical protein
MRETYTILGKGMAVTDLVIIPCSLSLWERVRMRGFVP